MEKRASKIIVLSTLFVVILAVIAIVFFHDKSQLPAAVNIDTHDQPTLGKANAPLHFVVFEDLKCENCKKYNNALLPKIKRDYIDTGKAKYTLIALAFIPGSMPAANTAYCLFKQNKKYFFPYVEYVFHHQPSEDTDWASIATLIQYAKAAVPKANLTELSRCMITARYNKFIDNNLKLATAVMGDNVATPALYLNGHKIEDLTLKSIDAAVNIVQKTR